MTKSKKLIENIDNILEKKWVNISHEYVKEPALREETSNREFDSGHRKALAHYTDFNGEELNDHLRKTGNVKSVRVLQKLSEVTNHPTKHKVYVYRGITHKKPEEFKKGDVIHDTGFTSTSLARHLAHKHTRKYDINTDSEIEGTLFRIHVHPGTKGAYVAEHSEFPDEKEFLLHHGTSFKVGNTEENEYGHKMVNLHIHHQED